jgi:very-short-patch-repair endonuclease
VGINQNKREKRKCLLCGKEFTVKQYRINKGYGKYCSKECSLSAVLRQKGEKHPSWNGGSQVQRTCIVCGKTFCTRRDFIKRGEGKCCSQKCAGVVRRRRVTMSCANCRNRIIVTAYAMKQGKKFCSQNCHNSWVVKHQKGENSPLYQEKSPNWKGGEIIKNCKECGESFHIPPSAKRLGDGTFCSKSCRAIWYLRNKRKKKTNIESIIEDYLKFLNVKHEIQRGISKAKTVVDFYLPTQNLVIYADGYFWHKSEWAKKNGVIKKDLTQDLLLGLHGYDVLRLSEEEILNGKFKNTIKTFLKAKYQVRKY